MLKLNLVGHNHNSYRVKLWARTEQVNPPFQSCCAGLKEKTVHLMLEYTPRAIVLADGRKIADTAAAKVLTDEKVIAKANLKETSLFALSQMVDIEDGTQFVQSFIDYERRLKNR